VSAKAVVTVRLAEEPDLASVRSQVEARPELLARGPRAVLWAVLDGVVGTYDPVVDGLETDIDEIEDQIFADDPAATVSRRIYELHREVIGFQRAVKPLVDEMQQLRDAIAEDDEDLELRRLFRDLHGHLVRINDRIENFRTLLDNALDAHAAIVSQRQTQVSLAQTEQTKKISAWAAILYLPSMVGAIYGMNFDHFPELHWVLGYPFALGLMVASCAALYAAFKKRDWI
jgi:magnesium transporter